MFKRYLSYVEISTKITSVFAFVLSISYLFSINQKIDGQKTLVFFASMLIFDMTATAVNNYVDTKTNDQKLQFKPSAAFIIIVVQFLVSMTLGIYLVILTDMVVLILGSLCFAFGILYSYGPVSLSRQPLGELFSGFFYGLLIPFMILYINMPSGTYLSYILNTQIITVTVRTIPVLNVILLSIAPFCATANIMLANNICDVEKDAAVKRYTLPYYIGSKALYLFAGLYYFIYVSIIIMVAVRLVSPVLLISLLTFIPVQKNINIFYKKQEKSSTFKISIVNYIIIMSSVCLLMFISGF